MVGPADEVLDEMDGEPRVLVADDEETFLLSTADLLRREGFRCTCARRASEVVAALGEEDHDALVTDIRMPGNLELELLRKLPEMAGVLPVILVTGHPTLDTAIESVRLQVRAYLVKPVDFEELLRIVREAVQSCRVHRAVRSLAGRLDGWRRDLAQIESALVRSAGSGMDSSVDAFIDLPFRNVLEALSGLHRLARSAGGEGGEIGEFAASTKVRTFGGALKRTIAVLEKTKRSFKSKELAALRRELEELVGEN